MKPNHDEIGMGAMEDLSLRVSVATYNRVLFPQPQNGTLMLALERKATISRENNIRVRAQPFGGGVRILNSIGLQKIVGDIQFDNERSKHEQDFRILIPPSQRELVKEYCLRHLENPDDVELMAAEKKGNAMTLEQALMFASE